jgi:hypothetical protein
LKISSASIFTINACVDIMQAVFVEGSKHE